MRPFLEKITRSLYPVLCFILLLAIWVPIIQSSAMLMHGFRPLSPVVVIESDDWGSYRALDVAKGDRSNRDGWSKWSHYDCLERPEDLNRLSQILMRHRDARGRSPVLTANVVFESLSVNKQKHLVIAHPAPEHIVFEWKRLRSLKIFHPQLHAMRESDPDSILSDDPDVRRHTSPYMVWKDGRWSDLPRWKTKQVVEEGQRRFKSTFGFSSLSTIAPRYVWSDSAAEAFRDAGITYFQNGTKYTTDGEWVSYPAGTRTKQGLIALPRRNIHFEPVFDGIDAEEIASYVEERVDQALKAFRDHTPVVLSTHRINYVSGHNPIYAQTGRRALDFFITRLLEERSELLFLTSDEIGHAIETGTFLDVFSGESVVIRKVSWLYALEISLQKDPFKKERLFVTLILVLSLFLWPKLMKA